MTPMTCKQQIQPCTRSRSHGPNRSLTCNVGRIEPLRLPKVTRPMATTGKAHSSAGMSSVGGRLVSRQSQSTSPTGAVESVLATRGSEEGASSNRIENAAESYAFDRSSAHADLPAIASQVEHNSTRLMTLFLIGPYTPLLSAYVSYSLYAATVAVHSELTVDRNVIGNVTASREPSLYPGVDI